MPPNVGAGYLDIVPSMASGWQKQITSDVDTVTKGIGAKFSSTFKSIAATAGGIFVADKVFDFLGDSVAQGRESIKIGKLTEAAIKSTGGAANVTAKKVADYAEELSNLTGIDDELIQSSENLLLSFTNVRNEAGKGNDIFDRATKASLDLSARGFGTAESAAVMLGKALNDPIAGMTALGRAGVTFSDDQKNTIRALVESNDLLGAQGIILEEVNRQVGGSAEAAATPMDRLKVTVGNLQEQLGGYLIPKLDLAAAWLADHLPGAIDTGLEKLGQARDFFRDEINPKLEAFGGFVRDYVIAPFGEMVTFFANNDVALQGLAITVGVVLAGAFTSYALSVALAAAGTFLAVAPFVVMAATVVGLSLATTWAINKFDWLRRGLVGIAQAGVNVVSFFMGLTRWVLSAVSAVGKLLDKLGPLKSLLGGGAGWLGSIAKLGTPAGQVFNLFGLADGGIAQARPGGVMANIAEAGTDEAVIPLNARGLAPIVTAVRQGLVGLEPARYASGGVTTIVNNYNPAPEPASDSTERALERAKLRAGAV